MCSFAIKEPLKRSHCRFLWDLVDGKMQFKYNTNLFSFWLDYKAFHLNTRLYIIYNLHSLCLSKPINPNMHHKHRAIERLKAIGTFLRIHRRSTVNVSLMLLLVFHVQYSQTSQTSRKLVTGKEHFFRLFSSTSARNLFTWALWPCFFIPCYIITSWKSRCWEVLCLLIHWLKFLFQF